MQVERIFRLDAEDDGRDVAVGALRDVRRRQPVRPDGPLAVGGRPEVHAGRPGVVPHEQAPPRERRLGPAEFPAEHRRTGEGLVAVAGGPGEDQFPDVVEQDQLAIHGDHGRVPRAGGVGAARSTVTRRPEFRAGDEIDAAEDAAGGAVGLRLGIPHVEAEDALSTGTLEKMSLAMA